MKIKIQIVLDDEHGQINVEDVIQLEKSSGSSPCVGLSLLESKEILKGLQQKIVLHQAEEYTNMHRPCPYCQKQRCIKGYDTIHYKSLFGIVVIENLRLYACRCTPVENKTLSILTTWLPEHISPELQYIETKWASYMSYEQTSALLKDLLPINATQNAATVRNHLYKTAKRQETELEGKPMCISACANEIAKLPKPGKPIVVGIDGGYVRSWENKHVNFEVIVGKSYSKTKSAKRFGFVQTMDNKPERRLLETLKSQDIQANQQIVFLSDGADNVRELQYLMHPESEHVLDWFHVAMRFTVLDQFSKGMIKSDPEDGKTLAKDLESAKWYLWHGNVEKALDRLEECYLTCDNEEEVQYKNRKQCLKHVEELTTYVENNRHLIPNYGEKWRCGEAISSSFVESTVNEVVTKRMVKKQQMQWSPQGAHYLLQARTATLNGDLAKHFERWYPGLKINRSETMPSILQKAA